MNPGLPVAALLMALGACAPVDSGIQQVSKATYVEPAPGGHVAGVTDVNAHRRAAGLAPVREHPGAEAAARRHAADMSRNDFISHAGSDGSNHSDRLRAHGCSGASAENIALGHVFDRGNVVVEWMVSPGHRKNILNPHVRHIGLAQVGHAWVMTLVQDC